MSKCLFCEKPTRMSEKSNKPLKYCSKKCANAFHHKKNSTRREGWGEAYHKKLKLREERKKEYEKAIEEGWVSVKHLAEELNLTKCTIRHRIKRCLAEDDTKMLYDGKKNRVKYISPAGIERLRNYHSLDLPSGPKKVPTEEQKERNRARRKAFYQTEEYKEKNRKRQAELRKNPKFRLRRNVGASVYYALKNVGKVKLIGSTFVSLPYEPEELCAHLEAQFDEHMTWENYGSYWSLDHIQPQSSLPYETTECENFKKCWALSNLRPLEARENAAKGSYYEGKYHTWKNVNKCKK